MTRECHVRFCESWRGRFPPSTRLDIHIHPPEHIKVYTAKNHEKPKHRESRNMFFDWFANGFQVPGGLSISRDSEWEDRKVRNCGIKVEYESQFSLEPSIKPFVLLELGFAQVDPNEPLTISSWAYDISSKAELNLVDNRALGVRCYFPEHTLIEKLDAISKKYRQEQKDKILPSNFIRHYYDIYKLLATSRIQQFIGSEEYLNYRAKIFPNSTVGSLAEDQAFLLFDPSTRSRYKDEYNTKAPMYYLDRPLFSEILSGIKKHLHEL